METCFRLLDCQKPNNHSLLDLPLADYKPYDLLIGGQLKTAVWCGWKYYTHLCKCESVCVCVRAQAVPFSKEVSKNNWRPEIGRDTQLSPAVQSQRPWLTWTDRLQFFNCKKANFVCVCVCMWHSCSSLCLIQQPLGLLNIPWSMAVAFTFLSILCFFPCWQTTLIATSALSWRNSVSV